MNKWKKLLKLYKKYENAKKDFKEVELEFESMADNLMAEGWEKFANGKFFEKKEPYHIHCPDCRIALINAIKGDKI